ncbi:hypothetical protein MTP99_000658 [Tenebrio molitor]|nr:hypothetical protein MTP99_000658 [Tenebrio molitor]
MSYARSCANLKEEAFRKQIFQKKLERYEEHNEKYRQGFGDLYSGNQQVCRYDRRRNESVHPWSGPTYPIPKHLFEIKSSFDWRDWDSHPSKGPRRVRFLQSLF